MALPTRPRPKALRTQTVTQVEGILSEIMTGEGVLGVSVVDRMGSPVASQGPAKIQDQLLYPLIATLAGAGHLAVQELEANPDVRVTAKSDRTRIHIAGIDEEHLLVTVTDSAKPWAGIRPKVNDARKSLRQALAVAPSDGSGPKP